MEGTVGFQIGPGVFPVNLVGREMQFWVDQNLPYPEEICVMWDELVQLSKQDSGGEPWIEESLAKLRVLQKTAAPLSPEVWHGHLADTAAAAEQFAAQVSDLQLEKPNPPRIASLRVADGDNIYDLGFPLYLKEDGDWKYNDSATIQAANLPAVVRRLTEVMWEIDDMTDS
jgi:hypothetical protein